MALAISTSLLLFFHQQPLHAKWWCHPSRCHWQDALYWGHIWGKASGRRATAGDCGGPMIVTSVHGPTRFGKIELRHHLVPPSLLSPFLVVPPNLRSKGRQEEKWGMPWMNHYWFKPLQSFLLFFPPWPSIQLVLSIFHSPGLKCCITIQFAFGLGHQDVG